MAKQEMEARKTSAVNTVATLNARNRIEITNFQLECDKDFTRPESLGVHADMSSFDTGLRKAKSG